jgi:hypothetical protein
METIVINTSEQSKKEQIIAFLKEIQVSFKVEKKEEKPYDPAFVERILKSREQHKAGKGRIVKIEDLWK